MKSILVVKLEGGNYTDKGLVDGFKDHFDEVYEYDWQHVKLNEGFEGMRKRLMGMAMMYNPDFIFLHVQNENALDRNTVEFLTKEIGFTVNYTFDCRDTERTKWMYDIAPYVGLTLFSNQEDVRHCKELGIKNCFAVQSSCDMKVYHKLIIQLTEKTDISFSGTNYVNTNLSFPLAQERVDMVEMLKKEYPNEFKVYGMGWKYGKLVNPSEEVSIYNDSAIAINHNNYDRTMYTSDRLWRIMACGTFCLTKYFKGIETIFEQGIHLDWWHTLDELKEKVDYYINYPTEREFIARTGSLFVRENHSWSERVKQIKKLVEHERRNKPVEDESIGY